MLRKMRVRGIWRILWMANLLGAIACSAAHAAMATALVAPLPPVLPPPTIKLPANEQPVTLDRYALEVQVRGLNAEVTATMTFHNPNGRPLEGELEFPLPDDATVCGYGLDVNGRMVDGVVVGKDRARMVLETERRQRIDPAIVEQVRGNVFRTRIYPVPASGTRTVRVTWTAPLAVRGAEAALRVPLPHVRLPELLLRLELVTGPVQPQVGGLGDLILTNWEDQHRAEARLTDITPGEDLTIRLPNLPDLLTVVERRGEERFLAISHRPVVPPTDTLPPVTRLAVAWDASGSRSAAGIARDVAFLTALLAAHPGLVLDVVVLRDVPEPARIVDSAQALATLPGPIDGGTGLARLDLRRTALPRPEDAGWILLSDGFGTVGAGLPAGGDVPITAVVAEPNRDLALLRLLTARSGGAVIDLAVLNPQAAAQRLLHPSPTLLRVDADPGVLNDVVTTTTGGRTTVFARLLHDGPVTLVYGAADKELLRTRVDLPAATPSQIVARAWAGAMAANLGVFPEANRADLVRLGQTYGVVTAATSLIVLENVEQYVRHRIEPPASWPEARTQYFAELKRRADSEGNASTRHLERVVAQWNERVAWWEGKVVPPASTPLPPPSALPMPSIPMRMEESASRPALARSMHGHAKSAFDAAEDGATRAEAGGGAPTGSASAASAIPGAILIAPFDPDTPYLQVIKSAPPADAYAVYLRERAQYATSPSFFLDCAEFFLKRDVVLGRRILSNLAELRLDDPALLRTYAWRLQQANDLDGAVVVLRRLLVLRPEEPQSYRDLALALAARVTFGGNSAKTVKHSADLTEALSLLRRVILLQPLEDTDLGERSIVEQNWSRFPEIEIIACEEFNRLVAIAERGGFDTPPHIPELDARLRKNLDTDMRIVLSWDADQTDIDLHVIDPAGEEAFYGHRFTAAGGLVSRDMTQGYGPEEYLIHHAPHGSYRIRCHFFGSHVQTLFGPVVVTATVFLDWGRATEQRQTMMLRLDKEGESIPVGTVTVGADPAGKPLPPTTVTREHILALIVGTPRSVVETRLGPPVSVERGGVTVLLYTLVDGTRVRLGFAPDLIWAREILNGVERELLPR